MSSAVDASHHGEWEAQKKEKREKGQLTGFM